MLSRNLEQTLHRALTLATERRHEYATLEHLLLGLADDSDTTTVLRACGVDLGKLRRDLGRFLDEDLSPIVNDKAGDPKPTAGFQRAVQRAVIQVQSSNRDEVTGANVLVALFSESESQAVYFLQLQGMTRQDAINFISYGLTKLGPPPALPAQGVGPYVEINDEGTIGFSPPEALDADGNHLPRLRALHPELCELAHELTAALGKGNAPHAVLYERMAAYNALINRELQEVDFRRLYAVGVRLANAAHATEQAISVGDLPSLDLNAREQLDSILTLHGSFILATTAGTEAILDEERYSRRPAENQQLRADTVVIAAALQNHPGLIAPDVAEQVLGAALEIGKGRNPERSTVAGHAILRNVMIGIAGGAIGSVALNHSSLLFSATLTLTGTGIVASWLGLLALNETVKKTKWFQRLTTSTASTADEVIDVQSKAAIQRLHSGLRQHQKFVLDNKAALSRLASQGTDFKFLDRALHWLSTDASNQTPDEKNK